MPAGGGRRASIAGPASAERLRATGIALPFAALFITLSIASSSFLTKVNLLNILDQQAATLIIAAAGTLVLVAGGIDLSVGAVYALAGVDGRGARLAHARRSSRSSLGVGVGLAVGLVNGLVVTRLRINALIATLAMSFVVSGLGHADHPRQPRRPLRAPRVRRPRAHARSSGSRARSGSRSSRWSSSACCSPARRPGATCTPSGGNAEAARLAGVRVDAIRVLTFVVSGGAAGLAGVIDASRVLSAQASSGDALAFTVLAGIVVGGTSILGGEGAVWRTFLGVLFIALIGNGYDLLGLDPLYEQITLGVILLAAVAIDSWARSRPNR